MKNQIGNAYVLLLVYIALIVGGGVGWVWNVVKVINSDFAHIGGMLVVRVIGIFIAPLGAVLGYF